jgi:hypothetical protein
MVLWELNPEVLGLLWLMASATWMGITSAEGLHDWRERAVPLVRSVRKWMVYIGLTRRSGQWEWPSRAMG